MNSDFFVDVTSLWNAINSLGLAKDNLDDLYTSLNNISTSKMDGLNGKSTFKSNRQKILKIYSNYDDSVCAIYRRIKELKEQVCMLDSSNALLFQMLDNGNTNEDFGSFVTGDVELNQETISTIQEQYNEYANIDQDLLTQTQWALIQSNNDYLNEQIAIINSQINILSNEMYNMIEAGATGADTSAIEAQIAVLSQQKKNLNAEDKTYLEQAGSDIVSSFNTVLSDLKNDGLGAAFESGKDFINLLKDTGSEIVKKTQSSVANFGIATVTGVGNFVEALVDTSIIALSTVGAGTFDIVDGIANSDWDFSHVKNNLDDVRAIVSKEVVNDWYDKLYDTDVGKALDEKSFDFFSSEGTGAEFGKGLGYSLGVIALATVTCGAAATPAALAATAGYAGFGKYTSDAWNNNSMTLTDLSGNVTSISLNSNDYQQIQDLDFGESTTINDLSIIKNIDGSYSVTDAHGNRYSVSEFDYTSNAEGLVKGAVNAGWEALQYGIGGKIGTSSFGLNSKTAVSGIRMGLDALTGAVEVPFQMLQMVGFDDMTLEEAWQTVGGWQAIGVQTALGGALSFAGEVGDMFKKADIDVNTPKNVSSPVKSASEVRVNPVDVQAKVNRYNELMQIANSPEYIQYMDYGRRGWAQELRPEFHGIEAELSALKGELSGVVDVPSSVTNASRVVGVSSNKLASNSPEKNIVEIINRHDWKYGEGDALTRLKQFVDPFSSNYGNYDIITSSFEAREILRMYSPEQIKNAMVNLNYIDEALSSSKLNGVTNVETTNISFSDSNISKTDLSMGKHTLLQQIDLANYHTSKGRFMTIDIDDISELTSEMLSKIANPNSVVFNIAGENLSFSNIEYLISSGNVKSYVAARNLKNEVTDAIGDISGYKALFSGDDLTWRIATAKKLDIELCKRLNYDSAYSFSKTYADGSLRGAIATENINMGINSINSDGNVICSGFSNILVDYLVNFGIFDASDVRIMGDVGKHRWVRVNLPDGKCLIIDPTNNIGGFTDLANVKLGRNLDGFIMVSQEEYGNVMLNPSFYSANEELFKNNVRQFRNIDRKIGYVSDTLISRAKQLFGVYDDIGDSISLGKNLDEVVDSFSSSSMDAQEVFMYVRNLSPEIQLSLCDRFNMVYLKNGNEIESGIIFYKNGVGTYYGKKSGKISNFNINSLSDGYEIYDFFKH